MNLKLDNLQLLCKQSTEEVQFGGHVSFFHGEMGAGKSTIAEMINFCLGGKLVNTPAVSSEVISVQLLLHIGGTEVLLERDIKSTTFLVASWQNEDEVGRLELPFDAGKESLYGDDVFNFSDFIFRAMSVPVLKVRAKKDDPDSILHRVSLRDFWKFCYLDQKHLDSSFFVLEQPIRAEKSKDVLKYVLGLHSDRLNTLQGELSEARQQQRTLREAAQQIHDFLSQYGFSSEAEIDLQLDVINNETEALELEREAQQTERSGVQTVSDLDRMEFEKYDQGYRQKAEAIGEIKGRILQQDELIAEFVSMKFKAARSSLATEILKTSNFSACPSCGSEVSSKVHPSCCTLCKSNLDDAPAGFDSQRALVEQDLDDRIKDLKLSVQRLKRSLVRQTRSLEQISVSRQEMQDKISDGRRAIESEYMQRARWLESKLGGLNERRRFLSRVRKMPAEIENRRSRADKMSEKISKISRDIENEEAKFKTGRKNANQLAANFAKILQAIHFPGLGDNDRIEINLRTWKPYIYPDGKSDRGWTFEDAGSGGKMVLFKMCFCLALHLTAAEKNLPIPRLIVIDSPMKNITPDINRDIFEHFYKELYRLLNNELSDWQCVIVDQTFCPFEGFVDGVEERKLTKSDPEYPALISYYTGH